MGGARERLAGQGKGHKRSAQKQNPSVREETIDGWIPVFPLFFALFPRALSDGRRPGPGKRAEKRRGKNSTPKTIVPHTLTVFSLPRLIVVPLSSHEVDGVRKEKRRKSPIQNMPTIFSLIGDFLFLGFLFGLFPRPGASHPIGPQGKYGPKKTKEEKYP